MPAGGDEAPRRQDAGAGDGGIAANINASGDVSAPVTRQDTQGGRDALNVGRDNVTHHHHYYSPGAPGPGTGGSATGDTRSGGSAAQPPRKIWGGVPARNPSFTGRAELLHAMRSALAAGDRVAVQALHGMGGVGKTQLAIEYAHRFADGYDIVWWVNSERPELIAEQFAALGTELGCTQLGAPVAVVQRAVLMALHERGRWLLVFDNVERPEDVAGWLPGGTGHVAITSRAYGWDELAIPLQVDVFSRAESVATLQKRVFGITDADASLVAGAVGDLPLAVAQAAGYMALTGIPAGEYVALLHDRPTEILERGKPWQYPRSLAAATRLSFDQMQEQDPVCAEVVSICAFLAPEPVPADWFPKAADQLPGPLGEQARDPVAWRQVIYRLRGSGLVRVDPGGLVMHRLSQAIIQDQLPVGRAAGIRDLAGEILAVADPGVGEIPATWPAWARVLPHVLQLDPATSGNPDLRRIGRGAPWYLFWRGDYQAAHDLSRSQYEQWRKRRELDHGEALDVAAILAVVLGELGHHAAARDLSTDTYERSVRQFGKDNQLTLNIANGLASNLYRLGDYEAARELHEDTVARQRRVLGGDNPSTLSTANNLALDLYELREYAAARKLHEDTLARQSQVLGVDHPHTLRTANNLARDLHSLREYAAARELYEDTLARQSQVLGVDHPDTLRTANNLALDLYSLREYAMARELHEDVLARRRRVLGPDHPHTIQSAENLAKDLRALGEEPGS